MRGLRTLAPIGLSNVRAFSGNQRLRHAAFELASCAAILEFSLARNTLANLGVHYNSAGGNLLLRLHPGTYLILIASFMLLILARPAGSGLIRLFQATPALACSVMLTLFCTLYSVVNIGFGGAVSYVESYLSAGMLAVALECGTDRQKRTLGWWILGLCTVSIVISLAECATDSSLIPIHFDDDAPQQLAINSDDVRGAGLFGDPLTAALATSMATFLLLRVQVNGLLKAAMFPTFLVGLLILGGPAALVVTASLLLLAAVAALARAIATRNFSLSLVGTIAGAVLILPPIAVLVINGTDVGERVLSQLYTGDSAAVRNLQWLALDHLNLHEVLFGVPLDRLGGLKYQLGLGQNPIEFDNPWLLMLLHLGSIGLVVFLLALGLLLAHLGRTTAHPAGWMLLIAAVVTVTTSNSLGHSTSDLVFMTACMVAMTGWQSVVPAGVAAIRRRPTTSLRRTTERVGARQLTTRPTPTNLAGLKP